MASNKPSSYFEWHININYIIIVNVSEFSILNVFIEYKQW